MVLLIRIQYNFHKFLFNPYRRNRHTNIALNITKYNTILKSDTLSYWYIYYTLTSLGKDYINFVEFKNTFLKYFYMWDLICSLVHLHELVGIGVRFWMEMLCTFMKSCPANITYPTKASWFVKIMLLNIVSIFLFLISFGWEFQTILYSRLHQILHCEFSKCAPWKWIYHNNVMDCRTFCWT